MTARNDPFRDRCYREGYNATRERMRDVDTPTLQRACRDLDALIAALPFDSARAHTLSGATQALVDLQTERTEQP